MINFIDEVEGKPPRVPLEEIAKQVVEHDQKAGGHIIDAAKLLLEARERIDGGELGKIKWTAWCEEHINLSASRIRELLQIAKAADPVEELRRLRGMNRARAAKHREAQGSAPLRNGGDDVSASPGDGQPAKLDQARLAEIGKQLVNEANDLATFDKIDATPQHGGIAVLLAVIDSDGRTSVRRYLDDSSVLQSALAAVGKSKRISEAEQDASDLSSDRIAMRKEAVASGLKRSPNIDKAHQTPQPVSL